MSFQETELKVITMEAGKQPELRLIKVKDEYSTSELISASVNGYIEALRLSETCTLWINEEGKLQGLEPNFLLTDTDGNTMDIVVGNVIFTGLDCEGNVVSLTDEDIELINDRFENRVKMKYYM